MFALAFAVLLEARFATLDAGLTTAAQASPRPRECRGSEADGGVWSRLRAADAQRYCDLLGRGYARLTQSPADALNAARSAEELGGASAAVRVLAGRAQLHLGQGLLAYEQLVAAEGADATSFADPKALHDYARAASLAGKSTDAVRLYRLLVSRAALLDDPRELAFCQIEAAAHVLALGPNGADEALGYLAQARLGLSAWVNGLRWLASQRSGRVEQGSGALPSADSLGKPPTAGFDAEIPLLPPGQLELLRAALSAHEGARPGTGKPKSR